MLRKKMIMVLGLGLVVFCGTPLMLSAGGFTWVGNITDPSVEGSNGNCPEGYSHFDLNNDGYEQNDECWEGIIVKDGKVGIGTQSPTATLDVNGNANISGGIVQEDWSVATLLNNWAPYANNVTNTPASFKDTNGVVHIKGFLQGNGMSGQTVFILPEGHRPEHFSYFIIPISGSTSVSLYINTNGEVLVQPYPLANELSLNGITFRAGN